MYIFFKQTHKQHTRPEREFVLFSILGTRCRCLTTNGEHTAPRLFYSAAGGESLIILDLALVFP